jgi:hypothetical protein
MANSRKDFAGLELVSSEYSVLNVQISQLELGECYGDIISRAILEKSLDWSVRGSQSGSEQASLLLREARRLKKCNRLDLLV